MKTYAIYHNGFFRDKPWWMPAKLHRVIVQRSNPRTLNYMKNYLERSYPGLSIVDAAKIPSDAHDLVLLYPDTIGLGWGQLEIELLPRFPRLKVLNGRGRIFSLDTSTRLRLRIRRFLEVTFLPELLFAPVLLAIGAFFALTDKFTGRS